MPISALMTRCTAKPNTTEDPLNREPLGPGARTLQSLLWGAAASMAGGLLFSVVMYVTGALPRVAQIVGGSSVVFGLAVHLVISALIGMSYGLLFRREATRDVLSP